MSHFMQAAVKGSYTPLADTLKQVDAIIKDDIVKVSYHCFHSMTLTIL